MAKLDKKVLKLLKTHQFEDLDAEDIAMQLKSDDDQVQGALDSLKDQGLASTIAKNGKTFWRLSVDEPIEKPMKADKFDDDVSNSDTVSFDISSLKQPGAASNEPPQQKDSPDISLDFFPVVEPKKTPVLPQPTPEEPKPTKPAVEKTPAPEPQMPKAPAPEPVKVKTEIPIIPLSPAVIKQESRQQKTYDHRDAPHDDKEADSDHGFKPPRKSSTFPIIGIAVAIVFSVVISAVIAMMIASSASKGISGGLGELEKKISEETAKQDQRIDVLSKKVTIISEKPAIPPPQAKPVAPAPIRSIKSVPKPKKMPPVKRMHARLKKKPKSSFPEEESAMPASSADNSSAPASPSASPAAAEPTPSASESSTPPPASPEPEASTPTPSSPEGSNP